MVSSKEVFSEEIQWRMSYSANVYGLSVIMGFADGIMKVRETISFHCDEFCSQKIFEMGSESMPVRYQLQAHQAAMISEYWILETLGLMTSLNLDLLITTDGVIITGAQDGTLCFYSLESLIKVEYFLVQHFRNLLEFRSSLVNIVLTNRLNE